MFGLESLDVLIGLVTVYLMLALACTAFVELLSTWLKTRSKNLEKAMGEFLSGSFDGETKFVDEFFKHPLIQSLSQGEKGRPSYIHPHVVSSVVHSMIVRASTGSVAASAAGQALKSGIEALPGTNDTNRVKGLLSSFVEHAEGDVNKFKVEVEQHFDSVMDRASGWVKRNAQTVTLITSLALVCGANVDTFSLAHTLSTDPAVREATIGVAGQVLQQQDVTVNDVGLQFGWQTWPSTLQEYSVKILGLAVSVFAISLGAPFWFDLLQKFMQVRASGNVPKKTNDT